MRPRRRPLAFTLPEVLVVLILVALLGVIGSLVIARAPSSLATEADLLAAHLRYSQSRALADVEAWRLEIVGGTAARLGRVSGGWERLPGTAVTERAFLGGVSVAGATEVRFDAWGRPVTGAGVPLASDLVLTLTDASGTRLLTITAGTGLVR